MVIVTVVAGELAAIVADGLKVQLLLVRVVSVGLKPALLQLRVTASAKVFAEVGVAVKL